MNSFYIIDGYVDEPTCLGVPPYISPYPRYIYGAIKDIHPEAIIHYVTIDQIRKDTNIIKKINTYDVVIFIAGISVPGKYLSGYPASPNELITLSSQLPHPICILCGPAAQFGMTSFGGIPANPYPKHQFDIQIQGDPEIIIHHLVSSNLEINGINLQETRSQASDIARFAIKGTSIVTQHPNFPDRLICEIETYRGCSRSCSGGCSFCIEPLKGKPDFRSIQDIISEIKSLYDLGIRHIRLGNQPCLFSYHSKQAGLMEYPIPNPEAIHSLFSGIRTIAPHLKTFHIDNVNPGILARYPEEATHIANSIITYHTPGDVAAFGVESVDPQVITQNNLKANEQEILQAIRLLNKVGKQRGRNGMPELLPGLNFVFGLKGERKQTYQKNYEFLEKILKENLLVRRINLRQVIPLPNTPMEEIGTRIIRNNARLFQSFKYKVRQTIEHPLLQRLIPTQTILTDVIMEMTKGNHTFGRQLGSYPILVGIHGKLPLHKPFSIVVTDHGYRSVTGFPTPFSINTQSREAIQGLPGIGKKRVIRILRNRPFSSKEALLDVIDHPESIIPLLPHMVFHGNENIDE